LVYVYAFYYITVLHHAVIPKRYEHARKGFTFENVIATENQYVMPTHIHFEFTLGDPLLFYMFCQAD